MLDIDLITQALRARGHQVGHATPLPENAGDYEFLVDGTLLTIAQVRALLESEEPTPPAGL